MMNQFGITWSIQMANSKKGDFAYHDLFKVQKKISLGFKVHFGKEDYLNLWKLSLGL